ncbi:HigA family addiction module antitoxin [Parasphingorhabdus sp.]|jgi:addiction module HigA family antidote|uniref:HigA family addiction module antitoxin n=1 Tax=Parasphingorhabdus sp. TaxID=2709688 RepID=UPI0039E67D22
MALNMHPSLAVHPGVWLKSEIIEAQGVAIGALANAFGVSRQAVSAILNGRSALSADMAIRFEKLFDVKADTLCRMQTAFDLANARLREKEIKVDKRALAA